MKFVVQRESFGDNVDVKLHWETKDKIKKVLAWTTGAAAVLAVTLHLANKPTSENTENE